MQGEPQAAGRQGGGRGRLELQQHDLAAGVQQGQEKAGGQHLGKGPGDGEKVEVDVEQQ